MILKEFLDKVKDLPLDSEINKWFPEPESRYHEIRLVIVHTKDNKIIITV